jgi:hypothetical protein
MKRCPQCEFIYEDDQSLCDMDGVLLVLDSRNLPNLHALATVSAPVPEKGPRRRAMVPAFATLILMLAVASVYYMSTMRTAAPPDFSPASVTGTTAEPAAAIPAAPSEDPNETAQAPASEPTPEAPAEETPRERRATPVVTKPAAAPPRNSTKPVATKPEPKKDDSKVESIIKKTGKLLKKPFKF